MRNRDNRPINWNLGSRSCVRRRKTSSSSAAAVASSTAAAHRFTPPTQQQQQQHQCCHHNQQPALPLHPYCHHKTLSGRRRPIQYGDSVNRIRPALPSQVSSFPLLTSNSTQRRLGIPLTNYCEFISSSCD